METKTEKQWMGKEGFFFFLKKTQKQWKTLGKKEIKKKKKKQKIGREQGKAHGQMCNMKNK